MVEPTPPPAAGVTITVDGRPITATPGRTLLSVLRSHGIRIPTLCHDDAVSPYGACRLCLVEITARGRSTLSASCLHPVSDGLVVATASERVLRARRMVAELLLARCPDVPRVRELARELGVGDTPRFRTRNETCVLCGLCVRGCDEIAGVGVLGFASRGVYAELATPFGATSTDCVGCTTCVYLCPTDHLRMDKLRPTGGAHPINGGATRVPCALCGTEVDAAGAAGTPAREGAAAR